MIRQVMVTTSIVAASAMVAIGADLATPAPAGAVDDTPWTLPERPPQCTRAQAESGDVAGCLLAFWSEPHADGYGNPPEPGVGDGWEWNGYTYNGSPALATWEQSRMVANDGGLAGLPAGYLETHRSVQLLFEGFVADISAGGYRVRDVVGYTFRCTSGNGGWSCPSGDPDDLSLHAYGLAIDMNASTNPIRSYSAQDGVTACRTPMQTDLPRWVIETAEKWGLYWGGYGWSGGCVTVDTERSVVYRDPPHFEFRGTPTHAAAIAAFNLGDDPNLVCRTVVDAAGDEIETCSLSTRPEAGTRLPITLTDAPDGATAALVNLTAAGAAERGFLTIEGCGPAPAERTTSAITFAPGPAVATMAVAPLDELRRFCVYHSAGVHSIVDVLGYLGPDGATEALWVDPAAPVRVTDTRSTGACAPGAPGCLDGPVPGDSEHVVPSAPGGTDDAFRIVNLVATRSAATGYLQAGGCGTLGSAALFSHLNYTGGGVRSNLALVGGGDGGTCVFASADTDVIVDELGRLDAESGYGWHLTDSRRVLDTRQCTGTTCGGGTGPARAGEVVRVDLGTDSPAAVVALTVVRPTARGFVSAGRCSEITGGTPSTSNLNHLAGQTVTNLALVGLDAGELCVYTDATSHLVIDVQAELVDAHDVGLTPAAPHRVHDSRERPSGS